MSTAYSLFVVGTTSLVGSVNYMRKHQVNYKAALDFFGSLVCGRFYNPQICGTRHPRSDLFDSRLYAQQKYGHYGPVCTDHAGGFHFHDSR